MLKSISYKLALWLWASHLPSGSLLQLLYMHNEDNNSNELQAFLWDQMSDASKGFRTVPGLLASPKPCSISSITGAQVYALRTG